MTLTYLLNITLGILYVAIAVTNFVQCIDAYSTSDFLKRHAERYPAFLIVPGITVVSALAALLWPLIVAVIGVVLIFGPLISSIRSHRSEVNHDLPKPPKTPAEFDEWLKTQKRTNNPS